MIVLKSKGDMVKKKKIMSESHDLDDGMMKHVETPVVYEKLFKKHDLQGQVFVNCAALKKKNTSLKQANELGY